MLPPKENWTILMVSSNNNTIKLSKSFLCSRRWTLILTLSLKDWQSSSTTVRLLGDTNLHLICFFGSCFLWSGLIKLLNNFVVSCMQMIFYLLVFVFFSLLSISFIDFQFVKLISVKRKNNVRLIVEEIIKENKFGQHTNLFHIGNFNQM